MTIAPANTLYTYIQKTARMDAHRQWQALQERSRFSWDDKSSNIKAIFTYMILTEVEIKQAREKAKTAFLIPTFS